MFTTSEIVKWLNEDVSDEQFAEIFALLEFTMFGRDIPMIYDTEDIILDMDVDYVCNKLKEILKEIQENIKEREMIKWKANFLK